MHQASAEGEDLVLEVGKAGSAGTAKGVLPVLRDGAVVAKLVITRRNNAAMGGAVGAAVIGGSS